MPVLTPSSTDLFQKVGLPGSATTLASPGYTIGNTGITVGSTTNHPTDTLYTFAIDRAQTVNGVTSRIAGTYCEFEGIVGSGTTIGSMVLKYGTAQNYPAGSFTRVYIPVSSNRENQLIVGLRQDHNGKGNHQTLTDDNGNAWLSRNQVASAVNNVQATNAITGGVPRLDAIGSDTNIPLYLGAKGSEVAHAENPEILSNFVASGGVIAISSGLIGTFSNIVYYIGGKRYKKSSVANKTYTATKDTYVDIDNAGNITYTEVANGAASPSLAANNIRLGKVVTGASITSITQYGNDSLFNSIYPTGGIGGKNIDFASLGSGAYSNFAPSLSTTSAAYVDMTSVAVTIQKSSTASKLKISLHLNNYAVGGTGMVSTYGVKVNGVDYDVMKRYHDNLLTYPMSGTIIIPAGVPAGSITIQGRMKVGANTATIDANSYVELTVEEK